LKLDAAGATDIGRYRTENQDAFVCEADCGFYAVADGLGGRPSGDVAAAMTCKGITAFVRALQAAGRSPRDVRGLRDVLVAAVGDANARVFAAGDKPGKKGMATTLVGALVRSRDICLAHAGDSRAYRLRGGELALLTDDHTIGRELIARGMPEEIALARPDRSSLTRAVGAAAKVDPSIRFEDAAPGDVLLLCSDGLHRMVPDAEIAAILADAPTARAAVDRLIACANERGGRDNVTAVVLRWTGAVTSRPRLREPARIEAAAVANHGRDRSFAADTSLLLPEAGLLGVATGIGKDPLAERAARKVVSTVRAAAEAGAPCLTELVSTLDWTSLALRQDMRAMSTYTGLLFADGAVSLTHVGHARCYQVRGGKLERLSADHTFAVRCLRDRLMTREQAERSPVRSLLVRALGAADTEVDVATFPVSSGDMFVLVSHGLHAFADDDVIGATLDGEEDVERAAVRLALAATESSRCPTDCGRFRLREDHVAGAPVRGTAAARGERAPRNRLHGSLRATSSGGPTGSFVRGPDRVDGQSARRTPVRPAGERGACRASSTACPGAARGGVACRVAADRLRARHAGACGAPAQRLHARRGGATSRPKRSSASSRSWRSRCSKSWSQVTPRRRRRTVTEKIQATHRQRRAVVYVRQSSPRQVLEHPESRRRQGDLKQRALELGWPETAIEVIERDLGKSAKIGGAVRTGFQHLNEEVIQGRVGAIFALEVARLARSSSEWHRLLDLCGVADVVIVDEQGAYHPADPSDRMFLGIKGAMSEAELGWMRQRMRGALLSKARRGEYHVPEPTGYRWDHASARLMFDPDEEVQRVLRLVFERFRIERNAGSVLRYFEKHHLRLPARGSGTDAPVLWVRPTRNRILHILHNPVYAGAYVYGRHTTRLELVNGQVVRRLRCVPVQAWPIVLKDRHPAYISWEMFVENQRILTNNSNLDPTLERHGAAHRGEALLQGLVLCGRCGRRMHTHYHDAPHYHGQYVCKTPGCRWSVIASPVDQVVVAMFLDALRPDAVALGLAVVEEVQRQQAELERQWELRLERARYEARLAERRYKAVDPEHRTVARTLEREWDAKLREFDQLENEHREVQARNKLELTPADRRRIVELSGDVPQLWHAETTTIAQRKAMLRTLVREVSLTPVHEPDVGTQVRLLWHSGTVSELAVPRQFGSGWRSCPAAVVDRIRTLAHAGTCAAKIAETLNAEGLRTGRGRPWTKLTVYAASRYHAVHWRPWRPSLPLRRRDGSYSLRGVASRLRVPVARASYWLKRGWLHSIEGGGRGHARWFQLDQATLAHLRRLRAAPARRVPPLPLRRADGAYSLRGVAHRLHVSVARVRYWLERGWLHSIEGGGNGHARWFRLDMATLAHLRRVRATHIRRPLTPPRRRRAGAKGPRRCRHRDLNLGV
jgi:serine/threonine protein phosphatase PrpC/DNA invertase Pin-like site-specific DNA recombinase